VSLEPRIKRAAPVFPLPVRLQALWEIDLAKDAYDELKTYFRLFDPLHNREEEIFTKLGYIDVQFLAPRIKAETMMTVGLMDTVCPPSSSLPPTTKIQAKKSLVLYPDFGHEGLPGVNDKIFKFMGRAVVRCGGRRKYCRGA